MTDNAKLPTSGQTIIFSVVPQGSYCRPGEAYRVEHNGKRGHDFRFVRVDGGSSTCGRPHLVARAKWQIV
ncbi:hypothetical protein ACRAVF_19125 [Bradyrhizobium oligotrophicum S58]